MGVSYKIEGDLAVVTNSGVFTYRDIEKALLALAEDQGYLPGMRILFIDKGSEYNPEKQETEDAASMLKSFGFKFSNRMAIVVSKDVHFGIARMIQTHCDFHGIAFEVFREEEAARAWLDKDPNVK